MSRQWVYALLVLVAGSSYGFGSSILKTAYAYGFNFEDVTTGQYMFSILLLWLVALLWRGKRNAVSKKQWVILILLGLAGAGTSYTYYAALTLLPASLGIVLLFQFSWMVMLMDILVTRRMPSAEKWVGMLFVVVGTVLAVGLFESAWHPFPAWAILLGLAAAFCYACTLYLSGYVDSSTSPGVRTALVVTVSSILIFAVFRPTGGYVHELFHGLWIWGLLMALACQVLPMLLMLIAIPHTGGRMAGVLGAIELPVSVLAANIFLLEPVSLLQWLGVCLILLGIIVSETITFRKAGLKSVG